MLRVASHIGGMKIKHRMKLSVYFLLSIILTLTIAQVSASSESMSKPYSTGNQWSSAFSSSQAYEYWGQVRASSCDSGAGRGAWAYIGALDSFGSGHQFTISADCVLKAYASGSLFGGALLEVYFEIRDADTPSTILWYEKVWD